MVKNHKYIFQDFSFWLLLFINIIVGLIAIYQKQNLFFLTCFYWCQSIIIGVLNFFRILQLKNFSVENFKINGIQPAVNQTTKRQVAFLFATNYGLFHLIFFVTLISKNINFYSWASLVNAIWLPVIFFLANHLFSFFYNRPSENYQPKIASIFFHPYLRIIPMYIIIIGANLFDASIITFLTLKILADVGTHVMQRDFK